MIKERVWYLTLTTKLKQLPYFHSWKAVFDLQVDFALAGQCRRITAGFTELSTLARDKRDVNQIEGGQRKGLFLKVQTDASKQKIMMN